MIIIICYLKFIFTQMNKYFNTFTQMLQKINIRKNLPVKIHLLPVTVLQIPFAL